MFRFSWFKKTLTLFIRWINDLFWVLKQSVKYHKYNQVGAFGINMRMFVDLIKTNTKLEVKNLFEIGANFAQDAQYLAYKFRIKPQDVYVFEAHPELYKAITKLHKFNAYNNAVYNTEEIIDFNLVPSNSKNPGGSSIIWGQNVWEKISVEAIRMDSFMNKNNIDKIDFLKLDVEGVSYQVLDGFGERIKDIQTMHIEAEHEKWGGWG